MSIGLLYGETTVGIPFDLSSYLVSIGQVMADRTGLIFMLKSDKTLADGSAAYSVTEGVALVVSGDVATAYITTYGSLLVDTPYFIGLGIKFAGDTLYREPRLSPKNSVIKFSQDVIRS